MSAPSNTFVAGNGDSHPAVTLIQSDLIKLRQQAKHLSLDALRVRARKGGNYLSHFKGRGMEFDEARLYQPGDDPRTIDWRVTARTGRAYTKLFREERERPVFCWVDLRASMRFATRGAFKSVVAGRLATLLAWAAVQRGDRLGGFVFNDQDRFEVRPALGNRAVLRLIHQMVAHQAETAASDLSLATHLAALRRVVHPGSLVALMSDFRGMDDESRSHLVDIAKHNDVLMFSLADPLDKQLPPAGDYPVLIGGQRQALHSSPSKQREWATAAENRVTELSRLAERNGVRWQEVMTDDEPLLVMQKIMGRVR